MASGNGTWQYSTDGGGDVDRGRPRCRPRPRCCCATPTACASCPTARTARRRRSPSSPGTAPRAASARRSAPRQRRHERLLARRATPPSITVTRGQRRAGADAERADADGDHRGRHGERRRYVVASSLLGSDRHRRRRGRRRGHRDHRAWRAATAPGSTRPTAAVTWSAIAAVSPATALLLRDTDRVRFVPDGQNGTSGRRSRSSPGTSTGGAASARSSAPPRPAATGAFSLASDTATITVTRGQRRAGARHPARRRCRRSPRTTPRTPAVRRGRRCSAAPHHRRRRGRRRGHRDHRTGERQRHLAVLDRRRGVVECGRPRCPPATALLLRDTDRVRFVPDGQNGTAASFSVRRLGPTGGQRGTKVTHRDRRAARARSRSATDTAVDHRDVGQRRAGARRRARRRCRRSPRTTPRTPAVARGRRCSAPASPTSTRAPSRASRSPGWRAATAPGSSRRTAGRRGMRSAPVSPATALLLRDTDRVRFVPDGQNGTAASFTFRAWDQTTGAAEDRLDVSVGRRHERVLARDGHRFDHRHGGEPRAGTDADRADAADDHRGRRGERRRAGGIPDRWRRDGHRFRSSPGHRDQRAHERQRDLAVLDGRWHLVGRDRTGVARERAAAARYRSRPLRAGRAERYDRDADLPRLGPDVGQRQRRVLGGQRYGLDHRHAAQRCAGARRCVARSGDRRREQPAGLERCRAVRGPLLGRRRRLVPGRCRRSRQRGTGRRGNLAVLDRRRCDLGRDRQRGR